jgi:hypothetical protein
LAILATLRLGFMLLRISKQSRFNEALVADLEAIDIPCVSAQTILEQLRIAPNLETLAVAVDLTPNERLRIQERFQR